MNYVECQYCEGQGYFTELEELSPWESVERSFWCPDCHGTGAVMADFGRGYFTETEPEQIEREEHVSINRN